MFHWLPYDETRLYSLLGVGRATVLRWARDDQHRTLGDLARRRGWKADALAAALVRPWRGRVDPAQLAVLRDRALRTLTQGHLAQHVLFHYFHQPGLGIRSRSILGVPARRYQRLRLSGRSPAQIAAAHGVSRVQVARRAMKRFRAIQRRGVAQHATTRRQAARFLRRQRAGLSHWLDSHIRKPGFGKTLPHRRERALSRAALLCFLLRGHSDPRGETR
jgi:hypothetical protein